MRSADGLDFEMHSGRRLILRAGLAFAALLGLPRLLLGAAWPRAAFESTVAEEALINLFGTDKLTPSDEITLAAPLLAENGAEVPVAVETSLENVRTISIVVRNNPRPLAASFEIPAGTLPRIACRIKMAETSDVVAVVQTGSGLYSTDKEVKVTIGGCA